MYRLDSLQIPKFVRPISKLPVFQPEVSVENNRITYYYQVESCEINQQILPEEFGVTKVWGFGGRCIDSKTNQITYKASSPGPLFIVQRNIEVKIEWHNNLKGQYMFPVDTTLFWANPQHLNPDTYSIFPYGDFKAQAPVPMVVHIHGAQLPPEFDGHPDAWVTANNLRGPKFLTNTYRILNRQEAATLWYHDNTRGLSRLNRYSGLVGAYLIQDFWNNPFHEIEEQTLVIQDKAFYEDASLYYPTESEAKEAYPFWVPDFYGDTIVVNGIAWPYMEIKNAIYRFRILNASNTRRYELYLSDNHELIQIGTDGGFIEYPQLLESFALGPGERIDVLIDFGKYRNGDTIVFMNKAEDAQVGTTDRILQFKIQEQEKNQSINLQTKCNTIEKLEPDSKGELTTFQEMMLSKGKSIFLFDGQESNNPSSNNKLIGSTFIWDFINLCKKEESIHLHLIQFQIVQRQKIDAIAYQKEWTIINGELPLDKPTIYLDATSYVIDEPIAPEKYEMGWKDTVNLPAGMVTRIVVRYAPTDSKEVTPGENKFPFNPSIGGEYIFSSTIAEHFDNDAIRPQYLLML